MMRKYSRNGFSSLTLFFAALGLIGWIIYLGISLPNTYRANHWNVVWIGFDIAMVGNFLLTSWALWKKRQVAIPAAMVTATFLIIDSWFDVVMSNPGADLELSIFLAVISTIGATQLFRFSRRAMRQSIRNAYAQAGREMTSNALWRTPLMIFEEKVTIEIRKDI